MKTLLNTLYISTQGASVHQDGETLVVKVERESKLRVPIHTIGSVVCLGRITVSPFAIELCAHRQVSIVYLSETGRFWGRMEGPVSGNVLLRRTQYRVADDPAVRAMLAHAFVVGKIANCRAVLQRALRDHEQRTDAEAMRGVSQRLNGLLTRLSPDDDVDSIRGHEGEAAQAYFSVFDHLVMAQKDAFFFKERSRRPPLDNLNALLSFVYTILTHDCVAALQTVGLDPAVGFLHVDRPGRPGLALDLMEEFRPVLADRLVLSLINRQQVKVGGFRTGETGGVVMDDATRKAVIVAYQERKREEIIHPFLGEKMELGLLPIIQATLLARHLRGDLDGYPPFLWK